MAQNLSLPVDIPWKRLGASSDMMDTAFGDFKFPPKWRSSVTVFYHELDGDELPETFQAFNFFFGNKKESYFEKLAESNVHPGLRTYGPS
jgi:hypothetical protein